MGRANVKNQRNNNKQQSRKNSKRPTRVKKTRPHRRSTAAAATTGLLVKTSSRAIRAGCRGDATVAARTNLTSARVELHTRQVGQGEFRRAYAGRYTDGIRKLQECVCKCFKSKYKVLETEFYQNDFKIADVALRYAQAWNKTCPAGKEILMTRGDIMNVGGTKYLVEPLIRYFEKFTSNNGWIQPCENNPYAWKVQLLEAFCHFTYHQSGGQLIVCDLQGRFKFNKYSRRKSRFELTDPAICSRRRQFGPTDLGIKGIETFFFNHQCNQFCHANGVRWASPKVSERWFDPSSNTSMLRLTATNMLNPAQSSARFNVKLEPIYEYSYNLDAIKEEDGESSDDEDSIVPMKVGSS